MPLPKNSYKVGDKVILKYPETNTWGDTLSAVRIGSLIKDKTYTIIEVAKDVLTDDGIYGICFRSEKGTPWWVACNAVVRAYERKYNLPSWW